MGNNSEASGNTTNNNATATADPNEWLRQVDARGELVYCEKRSARMHSKFCDILRKAIPVVSDSGYLDKTLKSINICNDCAVTRNKLSVRKFIEFRSKNKE